MNKPLQQKSYVLYEPFLVFVCPGLAGLSATGERTGEGVGGGSLSAAQSFLNETPYIFEELLSIISCIRVY